MNKFNTIKDAMDAYLDTVRLARSQHTFTTYQNALNNFTICLAKNNMDITKYPVTDIGTDAIAWYATYLKKYAATTEQLYLTAVKGFYDFLAAEEAVDINLPKVKLLIKQRSRRPGRRLPQFPADAIGKLLDYYEKKEISTGTDSDEILREMRDKAFLITLADTGLRVHEACQLRRGDIDWNEGKALIIGKGDKQAIVRFSKRSLRALKAYLQARSDLDGSSGRSLTSLPLFARHDKGAGSKVKTITPTTGRNIVQERVAEALGADAIGTITPHSFRHYFVTRVLLSTGNLKLAQNLARHQNIAVTQRYAHLADDELDSGYWQVFEDK
ncbi:MAG: tyrosine-type recombinase/integrase [Anaerolineaceae bacterium]